MLSTVFVKWFLTRYDTIRSKLRSISYSKEQFEYKRVLVKLYIVPNKFMIN